MNHNFKLIETDYQLDNQADTIEKKSGFRVDCGWKRNYGIYCDRVSEYKELWDGDMPKWWIEVKSSCTSVGYYINERGYKKWYNVFVSVPEVRHARLHWLKYGKDTVYLFYDARREPNIKYIGKCYFSEIMDQFVQFRETRSGIPSFVFSQELLR